MIEQLYYTWSPVGLRKISGWQVRAASPGLSSMYSERYAAVERYLTYSLPEGFSPVSTSPEEAPVSLELLNLGSDRVLMQKRFVGAGQRGPGIYFVHLLAGLPKAFTALEAISLWGSAFWRSSASELASSQLALPLVSMDELKQQQRAPLLTGNEAISQHLPFVIHAFLTLGPAQSLYIAAPSSLVAALIYGLVAALPRSLTSDLTFATYEKDFLQSPAKIVGTSWARESQGVGAQPRSKDLPDELYAGRGLALNCFSGRHSELPEIGLAAEYARFSANCLCRGEPDELNRFFQLAEGLAVRNAKTCVLAYRLCRGSSAETSLAPEDLGLVLSNAGLARTYLSDSRNRLAIIQAALAHRVWWEQVGQRLLSQLHSSSAASADAAMVDSLALLGEEAAAKAVETICEGDFRGADRLLHSVAKHSSPTNHSALWLRFLQNILGASNRQPEQYDWEARAWLLSQAAACSPPLALLEVDPRWLHVPWSELGRLLSLPLPPEWRLFSITAAVAERLGAPLARSDWDVVVKHHEEFEKALTRLMGYWQPGGVVDLYIARLLGEADKQGVFSFLLRSASSAPPGGSADILAAAANAAAFGPHEIVAMVEANLDLILRHQLDDETSSQLIRGYLWGIAERDSLLDGSIAVLRQLSAHGPRLRLPYSSLAMAEGWVRIYDYLESPSRDAKQLRQLGEALLSTGLRNDGSVAARLVAALASALRTADDLELALKAFGGVLAEGPWSLFLRLFRELDRLPGRAPASVYVAYWEAAFGRRLPPEVRGELENWIGGLLARAEQPEVSPRLLGDSSTNPPCA